MKTKKPILSTEPVLKFRVWSKKFGGMIYPDPKGPYNIIIDTTGGGIHSVWDGGRDDECVPAMQFTGFTDKNGTDIYRGDILKDNDHGLFEVVWAQSHGGFAVSWIRTYPAIQFLPWSRGVLMEVIGNIYDNPELINDK